MWTKWLIPVHTTEPRQPLKLISSKQTFLGTIDVPDFIYDILQIHSGVVIGAWSKDDTLHQSRAISLLHVDPKVIGDEVYLDNCSIEAFERMKGYAFHPSAAYIKSIIE